VGGKTRLLEIMNILLPRNFNFYFERLLSGGAVFLDLQPKNAVICDINNEFKQLPGCYPQTQRLEYTEL
jgi:DNA adenine methylase